MADESRMDKHLPPSAGPRIGPSTYEIRSESSDKFPEAVFAAGTESLLPYAVSFAVGKRPSGSGTLITIGQKYGILTAAHVVTDILQPKVDEVTIIFMNEAHRFSMGRDFLAPRIVGPVDEGPDLAFLEILDYGKLGTLKGKKSFFPLTPYRCQVFDLIADKRMTVCCLFGTPAEFDVVEDKDTTVPWTITRTFFEARAQVAAVCSKDGFDYLKMAVLAGRDGFPSVYGGVSGGGVWHIPLVNPSSAV
jgi:hypothetical protein